MSVQKALHFSILIFALLFMKTANANTFIGNGGDGVLDKAHWRMLDLVEAGIGKIQQKCKSESAKKLESEMPELAKLGLSDDDWLCLGQSFDHMASHDLPLAQLLKQVSLRFNWFLIDDELQSSNVAASYLNVDKLKISTLANRHLNTIRIYRTAWNEMWPLDRAALIVHEIIYATVPVTATNPALQEATLARNLTSQIFNTNSSLDILRGSLSGDHLKEPLRKDETFVAYGYDFPTANGNQRGIFLRRVNSNSQTSDFEKQVRGLYKGFFARSGSDFEVFWWINRASQMGLTCPMLFKSFMDEQVIRDLDAEGWRILYRRLTRTGKKIKPSPEFIRSDLIKQSDRICRKLI